MSVDPSKYSTIVNVRNIGEDITNEELKDMFSKYGTVTSCEIMLSDNVESGRFAYGAFEDPDATEEAIIELNYQELTPGRRIYLRRTGKKLIHRCKIIVTHLSRILINESDLRLLFDDYGIITSAEIIMENGFSKGYGFVSFATNEAANKAVTEMNGQSVFGERIHVALAAGTDRNKNLRGSATERRAVGANTTASTSRETSSQLGIEEIVEWARRLNYL